MGTGRAPHKTLTSQALLGIQLFSWQRNVENTSRVSGESTFTGWGKKEISLIMHTQPWARIWASTFHLQATFRSLLVRKNTIKGEHCKNFECHGTDKKREKGEAECQSAKIIEWNMHVLEQLQPHLKHNKEEKPLLISLCWWNLISNHTLNFHILQHIL